MHSKAYCICWCVTVTTPSVDVVLHPVWNAQLLECLWRRTRLAELDRETKGIHSMASCPGRCSYFAMAAVASVAVAEICWNIKWWNLKGIMKCAELAVQHFFPSRAEPSHYINSTPLDWTAFAPFQGQCPHLLYRPFQLSQQRMDWVLLQKINFLCLILWLQMPH